MSNKIILILLICSGIAHGQSNLSDVATRLQVALKEYDKIKDSKDPKLLANSELTIGNIYASEALYEKAIEHYKIGYAF